jgi:hypothetical protein
MSVTSFAQLSTRENDNKLLKLGTRPIAGDMALTFGVPINTGNEAPLYEPNLLNPGDFLTFKYYLSNDLAIRAAVKFYRASEKVVGSDYEVDPFTPQTGDFKARVSTSENYLVPGIEKHFLKSNIFDVYAGADALIGYGRNVILIEDENSDGSFFNRKDTEKFMILGLEGVVGVNVFVAQLPVSVGFEYGLGLRYASEGKTKVEIEDDINGETEYYTYSGGLAIPGAQYKELKASNFGMNTNQNVRLLLNIYFGL